MKKEEQKRIFEKSLEQLINAKRFCKPENIHFRTLDENNICDIYFNVIHNVFTNLDTGVQECIQIQDKGTGDLSVLDIKNDPSLLKKKIDNLIIKLVNEAEDDYTITLFNRLHTWDGSLGLDRKKFFKKILSQNFENKNLGNSNSSVDVSTFYGLLLEDLVSVYIEKLNEIKNKKELKKQLAYFSVFVKEVERETHPFAVSFTSKTKELIDGFIEKNYHLLLDHRFIRKELNKHNLQIGSLMCVKLYNDLDLQSNKYGNCSFLEKVCSIILFYQSLVSSKGLDRLWDFYGLVKSTFSSEYSGVKKILL